MRHFSFFLFPVLCWACLKGTSTELSKWKTERTRQTSEIPRLGIDTLLKLVPIQTGTRFDLRNQDSSLLFASPEYDYPTDLLTGNLFNQVYQQRAGFAKGYLPESRLICVYDTQSLIRIHVIEFHEGYRYAYQQKIYTLTGIFLNQFELSEISGDGGISTESYGHFENDSTYLRTDYSAEWDSETNTIKETHSKIRLRIQSSGQIDTLSVESQ